MQQFLQDLVIRLKVAIAREIIILAILIPIALVLSILLDMEYILRIPFLWLLACFYVIRWVRWAIVTRKEYKDIIPLIHETRCRKCQYILRGIPEPRCPECGENI